MTHSDRALEKHPLVASRAMKGTVLLVPIRQRGTDITKLYRLHDPVAVRVWQLIDGERSARDIEAGICREFDTGSEQAARDLRRFLTHLERIGAVRAKAQPVFRSLVIGGIGFQVAWQEARMPGRPLRLFKRFFKPVGEEGQETIRVRVRTNGCPDYSTSELLFDADRNWRLYRDGSHYTFEIFDPLTGVRQSVASVTGDFQQAEVCLLPGWSKSSPLPGCLPRLMQPLGQLLVIHLLARLGGVMVHALGIDDNGRGMVFVGPSGSGKSTLGQFWRRHAGVRILSDECVILRHRGGRLYAYGTPWSGLLLNVTPHPGPVEVQRVFFLGHHPEHHIWAASSGAQASQLFSQLFLPFWQATALTEALDFCRQVVLTTPCSQLGFAKQPSIVNFLRTHEPGGTR